MSRRVVIFGAAGATGRILTRQALTAGWEVTAAVRRPQPFAQQLRGKLKPAQAAHLRVVRADVYDPASVQAAIANHEAVISVVGVPFSFRAISVYSQSARALVEGMQATGVRRLLVISSGGTNPHPDPADGFVFRFFIKPMILRTTYRDMRAAEAIVGQSELDWTIVRPARLVAHPSGTRYRVREGFVVPGQLRTARRDLAHFLLTQLTDPTYIRKGVAIASEL